VKNWDKFPPTKGLQSALDQMGKDLVITGTNPNYPLSGLRWVFKDILPAQGRKELIEAFKFELKSPWWKEALQRAGNPDPEKHLADFIALVESGMIEFAP